MVHGISGSVCGDREDGFTMKTEFFFANKECVYGEVGTRVLTGHDVLKIGRRDSY